METIIDQEKLQDIHSCLIVKHFSHEMRTLKMTIFHTKIFCQYATVTIKKIFGLYCLLFFFFKNNVKLIVSLFIPQYAHD